MWPFSTTPKENPKIIVDGIEISFDRDQDYWSFSYLGTEFWSFGPAFQLPSKSELDAILATIESLWSEIQTRIEDGLRENGESEADKTGNESYSVAIQDFAAQRSFDVAWSVGEPQPEFGVDFTIRDGKIVDENWGD